MGQPGRWRVHGSENWVLIQQIVKTLSGMRRRPGYYCVRPCAADHPGETVKACLQVHVAQRDQLCVQNRNEIHTNVEEIT